MRSRRRTRNAWGLVLALLAASAPLSAQAPVVRAVLFYSPACPHCHKVINQDLPPLVQRYGDSLMIVGVDVTTSDGGRLIQDAAARYGVPLAQLGVPLMVVDGQVLMGDEEIPDRLPGIIDAGLARGGTPWPDLPRLRQALVANGVIEEGAVAQVDTAVAAARAPADSGARTAGQAGQPAAGGAEAGPGAAPGHTAAAPPPALSASAAAPAESTAPEAGPTPAAPTSSRPQAEPSPERAAPAGLSTTLEGTAAASRLTMGQRFDLDPMAGTVAVLVMALMLGVLISTGTMFARRTYPSRRRAPWLIPVLSLIGLGIALYLSYVEVTGARAVCGPVGDCNTVQQSSYARLLGVPVGVLGAGGYVVIGLLWLLAVSGPAARRLQAATWLFGATVVGTLFSLYLTFLEPFVIGATCAWCLGSAVTMTVLLVLATGVWGEAWHAVHGRPSAAPGAGPPDAQPPALV